MSQRARTAGIFIAATFAFTGIAFADSGVPVKQAGPGAKIAKELAAGDHDGASASGDHAPPLANAAQRTCGTDRPPSPPHGGMSGRSLQHNAALCEMRGRTHRA